MCSTQTLSAAWPAVIGWLSLSLGALRLCEWAVLTWQSRFPLEAQCLIFKIVCPGDHWAYLYLFFSITYQSFCFLKWKLKFAMKTSFPQLSVLYKFPYSVAWLQWPPSEASPPPPLKEDLFIFIHEYVCMCVCVYAHISVNPRKGQKRASEPLKLEVQVIFSCLR